MTPRIRVRRLPPFPDRFRSNVPLELQPTGTAAEPGFGGGAGGSSVSLEGDFNAREAFWHRLAS